MIKISALGRTIYKYYFRTKARLYAIKTMKKIFKDREYFLKLQVTRLKKLIHHAYKNSQFYHELFRRHNIHPSEIRCLNDLQKVPIISKDSIKSVGLDKVATKARYTIIKKTSGSTGIPLMLRFKEKDEIFQGVMWWRWYKLNGLNTRKKLVRIVHPVDFYNAKNNNIFELSVLEDPKYIAGQILKIKPNYVEGYPTDIYMIAKVLDREGVKLKVDKIFTHSELLTPDQRKILTDVFGTDPIDMYGSQESGCIAAQYYKCLDNGIYAYFVNIDGVIVEVIDKNNEWVSKGERGEIVVTNLFSFGMPFIRYKLGDVVIPNYEMPSQNDDTGSTCSIVLPSIKVIEGKVYDYLITKSGRMVSPHVPKQILGRISEIFMFRIIQDRIDHLTIEVVPFNREKLLEKQDFIVEKIKKAFNYEVEVDIEISDSIDRTGNKYKTVISLITE